MAEELLDIVDENNKLTGEAALRSKIHSEGIWHRTVHIYLFRKNNNGIELLVHLRSPFKDLYPSRWDARFGGHIKSGVTLEDGMKTELEEEVGLNTDGYKLIEGKWRKRNKVPNCEFTKTYFLEYLGDVTDLKFNDGEVQEAKWLSIQEIKNSMIKNPEKWAGSASGLTKAIDYLLKKLEG